MSKYITMVDTNSDTLAHGKFIAKVKGLGGKIRYFYDAKEYQSYVRGKNNTKSKSKVPTEVFNVDNHGVVQNHYSLPNGQHPKASDEKKRGEQRQAQKNQDKIAEGKARDFAAKQKAQQYKLAVAKEHVNNQHLTGHARDEAAKQGKYVKPTGPHANAGLQSTNLQGHHKPNESVTSSKPNHDHSNMHVRPKPETHHNAREDSQASKENYTNQQLENAVNNHDEQQMVSAILHDPHGTGVSHNPNNSAQGHVYIKPDSLADVTTIRDGITDVQNATNQLNENVYQNMQNSIGDTNQTPLSWKGKKKTSSKKKYVK